MAPRPGSSTDGPRAARWANHRSMIASLVSSTAGKAAPAPPRSVGDVSRCNETCEVCLMGRQVQWSPCACGDGHELPHLCLGCLRDTAQQPPTYIRRQCPPRCYGKCSICRLNRFNLLADHEEECQCGCFLVGSAPPDDSKEMPFCERARHGRSGGSASEDLPQGTLGFPPCGPHN